MSPKKQFLHSTVSLGGGGSTYWKIQKESHTANLSSALQVSQKYLLILTEGVEVGVFTGNKSGIEFSSANK